MRHAPAHCPELSSMLPCAVHGYLTFRTLFRTSEAIFEEPPVERGAGVIYRLFHVL